MVMTEYPIVTNGCYTLVAKDLAIGADLKSFAEWKSRFLMGFAICRNVFGMTFTNNWINGVSIYARVSKTIRYIQESKLQIQHTFIVMKKLFLKKKTILSFYRSSHFNGYSGSIFVGMENDGQVEDNGGNNYVF
jgi:hypothetical protein